MFSLDFVVDAMMMMFHDVSTDTDETQGDPCVASIEWLTADKQQKLVRKEGKAGSRSAQAAITRRSRCLRNFLRPVILRHHLTMVLP